MGTTCANLHIFVKEGPAASADEVGRWLTSACDKLGFEPSGPDDADLRLAIASAEHWLTIEHEGQAGILSETDVQLAVEISRAANSAVLVTALVDSDEFACLLFENGKQIDGCCTGDGIVPVKIRASSAKNRPGLWSRVFGQELSSDRIESVFAATGAFADEHLDRLCDVVQLPPAQSRFRHADHDPAVTFSRIVPFRRRRGEATVRQIGGVADYKKEESRRDLFVDEMASVSFEMSADVSALAHPVLEVAGSAVDDLVVEISKITGLWHCGLQHVTRGGVRQFEAKLARAEDGMIRAVVDEMSPAALQEAPRPTITFLYSVWLRAAQEGVGELQCTFRPRGTTAGGIALRPRLQLHVGRPQWRPLRSQIGDALRQLNDPQVLSAVVIVPSRTSTLADVAPKIEDWLRHPAGDAPQCIQVAYEGQMVGESFRVPRRNKRFKFEEIGTKKWHKLFADQPSLQSLFFQVIETQSDEAIAGASVQRPCADVDTGQETFHLGFWRRMDGKQESRDQLTRLVDEIFVEFTAIQAWRALWNWIPRFTLAEENYYTPYEEAKGVGNPTAEHQLGKGYMQEQWCSQQLRGFGERLWLGAALCQRIDRGALQGLAKTTDLGTGVVLDLEAHASLTDLETALEAIIPPPPSLP